MSTNRVTQLLGDYAKLGTPALLLLLAGIWLAYRFVEPAPPSRIEVASGEPTGAYARYAERYREALADHGVELAIRQTAGSAENLELLRAGEVDIAFVQGGVAARSDGDTLLSLGSIGFEPIWVFYRGTATKRDLRDLRGMRIAAGAEGSGTRAVALPLLEANAVAGPFLALGGAEAATALREGGVDAAFFIAAPDAQVVQDLLADPNVAILSFSRAAAYARTLPYLSELTLPEGTLDLAANVPAHDLALLSPTANLVIGKEFHPALVDLILQAAVAVHSGGGVLNGSGVFPTPEHRDLPLSAEAKRFYEHGPPFLQRYLPFWLATLVDRLKIMLIPLIALAIPLIRVLPPTYRWRVRSRIYRWYSELASVDPGGNHNLGPEAVAFALKEIARIEDEVARVPTPVSYARELYDLRVHIGFVRAQLESRRTTFEQS